MYQVATSRGYPCTDSFLKYSWAKFTKTRLLNYVQKQSKSLPLHGWSQETPGVSWICEHCLTKRLKIKEF